MEKWPIGVFASIDHGLGVKLEVARDLGVPTIQLHAPSKKVRTAEHARDFLASCAEMRIADHGGVRRLRGGELRRHSHDEADRRAGAAGNARGANGTK